LERTVARAAIRMKRLAEIEPALNLEFKIGAIPKARG
jgi:hypothetical protein